MGVNKAIGSLFIDIEARTAKLETDMGKVKGIIAATDREVQKHGDQWTKTGKQIENSVKNFALTLVLGGNLVNRLALEFRAVVQNIEKIPGVPPQVVASVQELRQNLETFYNNFQIGVARVISVFQQLGKSIGTTAGAMVYGWKAADEAMKPLLISLDDLARATDKSYDSKIISAQKDIVELRRREALSVMGVGDQIKQLHIDSERERAASRAGGFNTLEQLGHEKRAIELLIQANDKKRALDVQLKSSEDAVIASVGRGQRAMLSKAETVRALSAQVNRLQFELAQLYMADPNNKDANMEEKKIELNKRLARAQNDLATAAKRHGDMYNELGRTIADNFGEAIMQGENLSDTLNKLLGDIIKIILQRQILSPLASMLGGGMSAIFGGMGGMMTGGGGTAVAGFGSLGGTMGLAAGGPISGPRLVGEFGPEIFNPGQTGTIIPNEKLSMGGNNGNTFYQDFRGVDESVIKRIEQMTLQLAGPGVTERRAVGASVEAGFRRGGVGRTLNGY